MTWVRIDDGLPEHPKALAAGDEACWLFVAGLCFCARNLTDGFIPEAKVPRLTGLRRPEALAKRLVGAGMWDEVEGGYRVHDYDDYQPTKAQVEQRRSTTRERVRKHRRNGVTSGGETPLPHRGAGAGASGQLSSPPTAVPETDRETDVRAPLAALHPRLSEVLAILEPLDGMLTEPAAIDSALQANPRKDHVAAAHRVASIVHGGQNRTVHTNALLMSVLQRMDDTAGEGEREFWEQGDELLRQAMNGGAR